jgi:hypothetical protein
MSALTGLAPAAGNSANPRSPFKPFQSVSKGFKAIQRFFEKKDCLFFSEGRAPHPAKNLIRLPVSTKAFWAV